VSQSLNVLVVSSKYPPEYSGSGLRAHRTYLRLQKKYGISFEVICSSTESDEAEQYEIDGIAVQRIVSKQLRKLNRKLSKTKLRRLTNAVMSHKEAQSVRKVLQRKSFDLVHTFGNSPATATAIHWSRTNNKPLLIELVNANAIPYQYLPIARLSSPYDLTTQTAVVAISEHLREVSKNYGLVENVWVRPNPVEVDRFRIPSETEKLQARETVAPAHTGKKLIVYVAKYLARKNHAFLIDVLAKLPKEYALVLAGPPSTDKDLVPGLRQNEIATLVDSARSLKLSDRITISSGFVDMAQYLSAADVFCFPAEQEGMGTPLLESISAGVPVVANADESSFREWITDGENGYLRKLNAQHWADAISLAAKFSSQTRIKMSDNIKGRVSTDSIDREYKKLLSAVASSKPNEQINVFEIFAT
jgi:glycosyltransferase involved in cell wall biosynthesis